MENPATRGEAEKVIRQVLHEDRAMKQDGQVVIGLSLERRIADALRAAGLLREAPVILTVDEAPLSLSEDARDWLRAQLEEIAKQGRLR